MSGLKTKGLLTQTHDKVLIEEHTLGGIPAASAWHWNRETNQKLGSIVHDLVSGNKEKEKRGYVEFYKLRRHFLAHEFQNKMERLKKLREANKHPSIDSLLENARLCFIRENTEFEKEPKHMKSRITKIKYARVKNLSNYENCRVEAEAEVVAGEKPSDVMKKLRLWVEKQVVEPITDND